MEKKEKEVAKSGRSLYPNAAYPREYEWET